MHPTTQLCNFYIGLENQPKKINQKNQNKITFIYAPYYTIMELLHWTLDLTINPKKSKKNQNNITFIYAPYYTIIVKPKA